MAEEIDAGGWAPALDSCPHVEAAVTIPQSQSAIPDLSRSLECSRDDCHFTVPFHFETIYSMTHSLKPFIYLFRLTIILHFQHDPIGSMYSQSEMATEAMP